MVKSARAKRMEKHHKRNKGAGTLNLVSLMDIFTILVFFLLVNSSDVETLPNAKDLQLPESNAEQKARENVIIVITDEAILVQGRQVAAMADVISQVNRGHAATPELSKNHEPSAQFLAEKGVAGVALDGEDSMSGRWSKPRSRWLSPG